MPRLPRILVRLSFAAMLLLTSALTASADEPASSTEVDPATRPVIGPEYHGPIQVVYQVTRDEWKEGVSKPLLYLKNVRGYYTKQGYASEDVDIRAVFHGQASAHLLTDEAYNRERGVTSGNPNTALLAELAGLGVKIELCDVRRQREGWSKADIHPDVLLANAAFPRLIDLQHQGYAYIRF